MFFALLTPERKLLEWRMSQFGAKRFFGMPVLHRFSNISIISIVSFFFSSFFSSPTYLFLLCFCSRRFSSLFCFPLFFFLFSLLLFLFLLCSPFSSSIYIFLLSHFSPYVFYLLYVSLLRLFLIFTFFTLYSVYVPVFRLFFFSFSFLLFSLFEATRNFLLTKDSKFVRYSQTCVTSLRAGHLSSVKTLAVTWL